MKQVNWEVVTQHCCLLGEGPVWDAGQKRIFWIDILGSEILYFYPGSNQHLTCKIDGMPGAIALMKSGGILAAVKGGFATIDLENGTMKLIAEVEADLPGNRFNDGKCDPAGRFWAGTMSMSGASQTGSLYTLEKGFYVHTKLTGVSCSNGLAWSGDHKILYYIDTPTRKVMAYNFNVSNGGIKDPKIVIDIPEKDGYPDGMTIDKEGMLWIALWDGWKVARYNPVSGQQLHEFDLPVSRPTSCVFGGDTFNDLYITSARDGLSVEALKEQPLAGSLFVIKECGYQGMDGFEYDG